MSCVSRSTALPGSAGFGGCARAVIEQAVSAARPCGTSVRARRPGRRERQHLRQALVRLPGPVALPAAAARLLRLRRHRPTAPSNTLLEFPTAGCRRRGVSLRRRPTDITFALDEMLAANQDSTSPFFGGLDPERIGMSGHSFGRLTTYFVIARDSRFKVAMPMAPATLVACRWCRSIAVDAGRDRLAGEQPGRAHHLRQCGRAPKPGQRSATPVTTPSRICAFRAPTARRR